MNISVIGDIAGRYDELMDLVEQLPDGPIICVGDLVDRGPKSKEVIEWGMLNEERVTCLYGNHEDMMVTSCGKEAYDQGIWLMNGGQQTLESYGARGEMDFYEALKLIPMEHVDWLRNRPRFFENSELLVTHAPVCFDVEDVSTMAHLTDFIWNRQRPARREKFQVFGHNSTLWWYGDTPETSRALCIDNSSKRELCAVTWPEREIIRVPYLK